MQFKGSVWIYDLLASVIQATAADCGNVQLYDSSSSALRIAAQHGFETEFLDYLDTVRCDDDCAYGLALKTGSRIVVTNVATDSIFQDKTSGEVMLRAKVRSVQSTPLIEPSASLIGIVSTHFNRLHNPLPQVWKDDHLAAAFMTQVQTRQP